MAERTLKPGRLPAGAVETHYDLTDSGMTKGEYFTCLGHLEQREYLTGHTIVASYDGERITAGEVISNDDDGVPQRYTCGPRDERN